MELVNIDQSLCTGCRRCAEVCPVDAIVGRENEPQTINTSKCVSCGQCIQICNAYASEFTLGTQAIEVKKVQRGMLKSVKEPLFAAYNQGQVEQLKDKLANPQLFKIVQCAPAVRVALGEEFAMPFGALTAGKLASALKRLQFDRVYDTNFAADLTIMEEGSELIERIQKNENLPMMTSCCPAWVKFAEDNYPELLNHLSSCKSPQQMAGAIFKTYGAKLDKKSPEQIYSVAVMPCTCKSFECEREEMKSSGYQDVDLVITTRELAQLIKDQGIDFQGLEDADFDQPLGHYSGAGNIFGATGGVMEAAIRTGYELITQRSIPDLNLTFIRGEEGIRTASVQIDDLELKIAVISGLKHVRNIMEAIKTGDCDYHFIEVMTCPQGCVSGGGQPKLILEEYKTQAYAARKASLYQHDATLKVRKSHENPGIKKLYADFLEKPLGHKSHELLHTHYINRKEG